ncbi:FtsX-like permease family protein [Lapillicoccus jejuensis]|uniref:FtsX-like permease family protein n=1 Tax=Lapillicoccus jejuensis TaxID=402171 RepID=A0A542E626_9MICO|nr:FtsX-like permease family protein [Lapillicoccus jejuensis]TQJ10773.1 FtsX-like permease family protein [Lapillicoccus jejuensis]
MWAAIRYRRAQALGLALLTALVTASAVFAALYERALEQSLLREGLLRQGVAATAVTLDSQSSVAANPSPTQVRSLFPTSLAGLFDGGSDLWTGHVSVDGRSGTASVAVYGPQDTCRGLRLVTGRCPSAAFEVLVSADEARLQGYRTGQRISAPEEVPTVGRGPGFAAPFTVVGTYTQLDDPGHWLGIGLTGRAGRTDGTPADNPLMDAWVTPEATFATGWLSPRLTVAYLLDRDRVDLASLPRVAPEVARASAVATASTPPVLLTTRVDDLAASVAEGQRQARVIVPLVVGQLVLLAVVVLGLVAASAVEQRRPEVALVRLRGEGGRGAARRLLAELGTVAALGVPLGVLAAFALDEVARRTWLTPGVPFEVPWTVWPAAAGSLLVAVLALAVVVRPTVREPVATLLRRVPPRRRGWAVGLTDAVVVTVAVAGVASVVTGNVSGPLVLLTPTLLALAAGLLLAHVLVPAAAALGAAFVRRGRVAGAVTALQVARRPAVRRVVTIITVATALAVFAADAVVVGQRNRTDRAQVEVGATRTLATDASRLSPLLAAVRAADPSGRHATAVVVVPQGDPDAVTTMAVQPASFVRVARFPRTPGAFDWADVSRPLPAQPTLVGRRLAVTVDHVALSAIGAQDPSGSQPVDPAGLGLDLSATVLYPGNAPVTADLGTVPVAGPGPVTLATDLGCAGTCRLAGFVLQPSRTAPLVLSGRLTVASVTMDGTPVDLGAASGWVGSGTPDPDTRASYAAPQGPDGGAGLGMQLSTDGDQVRVDTEAAGAPVPALLLGGLPPGSTGQQFTAAGLDGLTTGMVRAADVPYAPGGGAHEALVDLDRLAARTDQVSAPGTASVWVTDAATEQRVRAALAARGVAVTGTEDLADRQALYDASASAWGLQMALVIGVVALLVAGLVLVLVAAASARTRSRDLGALRLAGVPARTLAVVAPAEQVTVVLVGVVAGLLCGLVGAHLAVPLVPFFTVPSTVLPVDTAVAVLPVLLVTAGGLLLLLLVGLGVASRQVRAATVDRVRDQL